MAITKAYKDTYWNNLRVERNIKVKEIAEYLNVSLTSAGGYFSGQLMPKDLQITQLCGLFDVPVDVGREEFKKAHALWKSERKRSGIKVQSGKFERKKSAQKTVEPTTIDNTDIIKMLYGKLPYDVFVAVGELISSNDIDTALKQLYGRVSCNEFIMIWRALENE